MPVIGHSSSSSLFSMLATISSIALVLLLISSPSSAPSITSSSSPSSSIGFSLNLNLGLGLAARADNPCGLPSRVVGINGFTQFKASKSPMCVMFDQRNKTILFPDVDVFTLFELSGSFIVPTNNSNITVASIDPSLLIPTAPTVNCTVNNTQVPCANDPFLLGSGNTQITIQVSDKVSPAKTFVWFNQNFNETYVVPFFTVMVDLDNGKVRSVGWDEGCYSCDDTECNDNQCGIPISNCYGQGISCDFKVYIAWTGTDDRGTFMTSAGKRLSAFRQFSARTAFLNAAKTAKENQPSFSDFPPLPFT